MADDHLTTPQQTANKVTAIALRIVSPTYIIKAMFFVFAVLALLIISFLVRVPVVVEG